MRYVALKHLKWGDTMIAPGESVPDEEGRSYASLLRTKRIAKVPDSAEMGDAELAEAYEKVEGERDAGLKRLADLEDETPVEVPDDVTVGETPGWPINAVTGTALDLTEEQRTALAADEMSGEAIVTHEGEIVSIEAEADEVPGQDEIDATESAAELAAANDIDLGTVEGTGDERRVVKADVQKIIDARS